MAGMKGDSNVDTELDPHNAYIGTLHLNENIKKVFLGVEQSRFSGLTDQGPRDGRCAG